MNNVLRNISTSVIWYTAADNTRQYSCNNPIVCIEIYVHSFNIVSVFRKSAQAIDPKVQRGLFIFAVSNSCIDPIVYGMYR